MCQKEQRIQAKLGVAGERDGGGRGGGAMGGSNGEHEHAASRGRAWGQYIVVDNAPRNAALRYRGVPPFFISQSTPFLPPVGVFS